jgi:ABC-type Mn2+/Zn2+ transport system ATPase subunit
MTTDIPVGTRGDTLVAVTDASLGYGSTIVVERFDFTVKRGDFIGIVGPNGSGKTTILRSILGLLKPRRGRIEISPGVRFGYVIQRQALDPIYPLTVGEVVAMGRFPRLGGMRRLGHADRRAVSEALALVDMATEKETLFRDCSGGQKQRTLIARALVSEPDALILDEPTNDLDIVGENAIMDLIHDIHHQRRVAVVIVSHLLHVLINHVESFLFITDGRVTAHSLTDIVERGFLTRLYGIPITIDSVNGKRVIIME